MARSSRDCRTGVSIAGGPDVAAATMTRTDSKSMTRVSAAGHPASIDEVRAFLRGLQDRISSALEAADGRGRFAEDAWQRAEGGGGRSRVMKEGAVFEQAGVGFSEVSGAALPPSASAQRPAIAGRAWTALGVSLVLHPRNPYLPTTHMNVRYFEARAENAAPV